jgi:hypothetical protein
LCKKLEVFISKLLSELPSGKEKLEKRKERERM